MGRSSAGLIGLSILVLGGCASSPESAAPAPAPAAAAPSSPSPAPAAAPAASPGGITYQEDKPLGGRAWVAPGFDPKAYDVVYLAPIAAQVPKLNPDGVENLEWAKGVLRDEVARTLRASSLFPAVVTSEADIKPGSRALRFEQTIVEYEKGGGGARFFAGLYGAGQPVLKVQGRLAGGPPARRSSSTRPGGAATAGPRGCSAGTGATGTSRWKTSRTWPRTSPTT
jgi:hypothetical protein